MRDLIQQGLALRELLRERILILDGAMGTMLQQENLTAADFGGRASRRLQRKPGADAARMWCWGSIESISQAGADIIETNSFGSTPVVLAEYGLAEKAHEISRRAAELARKAADELSTAKKPRFVAGSMGPTTKAISVTGGITFEQLRKNFYDQAKGLIEGGADLLLLETCQDTRNIKAGALAINELSRELGQPIPVMISGTIEPMGTMLAGQTIEALWASLDHAGRAFIGLNCATGPEFMTDHVRTLNRDGQRRGFRATRTRDCRTRKGVPGDADFSGRAAGPVCRERLAEHCGRLLRNHASSTSAPIAEMAEGRKPRTLKRSATRGLIRASKWWRRKKSTRPLIVGERTNVIGSRAFKKLVAAEKWEEATEIARRQVKSGAHIVDVCLQSTDRDEMKDIPPFYEKLIRKIKAPVMIDTTDPRAIELSLTYCQGKSIINFDQPGGWRREVRARCAACEGLRGGVDCRHASTRTRCRRRRSRGSASWPWRSGPSSC